MTSPIAIPLENPAKKKYKMRLLQAEAMLTPSGFKRYPAGAILLADEDTAARWYENNVAELAPPTAETFGEIERRVKREEFFARAEAVEGTFDALVTRSSSRREGEERQLMPPPMPVPPRRRATRVRPDLEGAGVINALEDEE